MVLGAFPTPFHHPQLHILTPNSELNAVHMLPITLRALSYHRTRYLPHSMRLLFRISAVGTSPRHGPSRVDTGPRSCQSIRRMSSSPSKHLFVLYAPDYVRPEMLDHRLSVREKHLEGVDGLLERGIVSACDVQLLWDMPPPMRSL